MKRLLPLLILLLCLLPARAQAATPDAFQYYAIAIRYKFDYGYPYVQIEIGTGDFHTTCSSLEYRRFDGVWIPIGSGGHWQNYDPYGTAQGSHYYHIGVTLYVQKWLEGGDLEGINNWRAYCSFY